MHLETTYGPLRCTVTQATPGPVRLLVVLCHGYGSNGLDMVQLAQEVGPRLPFAVRFVLPRAPLQAESAWSAAGGAWWPLDVPALLAMASQPGLGRERLLHLTFDGLAPARRGLRAATEAALQQAGLPTDRLVLAGFSQGAMLTTDLALSLEEPPAGLAALSGVLIDQARWKRLAARRAGLPIFQSHGRLDPVLPYDGAEALRSALTEASCVVDFVSFDGGHTVPPEVQQRWVAWLAQRSADRDDA